MTVLPTGLPTSETPHCVKDGTEPVGSNLSHTKTHPSLSLRSERDFPGSNIKKRGIPRCFQEPHQQIFHTEGGAQLEGSASVTQPCLGTLDGVEVGIRVRIPTAQHSSSILTLRLVL